MRKMFAIVSVFALAGALGACKKKEDKNKADKPVTKPPVTKPAPAPKPSADTPEMVNKMANCPNAVKGAITKIAATDKAVVLTVTAMDKDAMLDIRKRAKALAGFAGANASKVEHSGKGTGGGRLGACPVVMNDTTLAVADVDNGATITLTPKDAAKLGALKADVEQRNKKLAAGDVKMGDGSGKGKGDSSGGGGKGGHGSGTGGGNSGGGENHD